MADMTQRPLSRRPRVVTIGGATYDLFVQTPEGVLCVDRDLQAILLPVGRKVRVHGVTETCGGGASNTAVGLSRLGYDTAFCGIIGSDQWGDRIRANLTKEGVDAAPATIVEGEMSSFSLILNVPTGERCILYATGSNAHLHDATFDKEAVAGADWIVFNHIHEKSCTIMDDLVEILRGYPRVGMTWNPGGRQLTQGMDAPDNAALIARASLLLLNKEEALVFTGKSTVPSAIRSLVRSGAENVVVSDGAHGCDASDGRSLFHCPAVQGVTVTDTTGAGDAFGTGATWALLEGQDLPMALKAGTMNAASVLGAIGAQAGLLTDIALRKKLQEHPLVVDTRPL